MTTLTTAATHDTLTDADYRDIYDELRAGHALRGFVESAKELDGAQRQALVVWGKPAPVGTGSKSPWALSVEAVAEYRRILGWADSAGDAEDLPF